jgi:hypothetical protein
MIWVYKNIIFYTIYQLVTQFIYIKASKTYAKKSYRSFKYKYVYYI